MITKTTIIKFTLSLTTLMVTSLLNAQTILNGSFNNSICVFCAASPWIIEEGSPDISAPGKKWSTTNNYEFINVVRPSPDGGNFANFASDNSTRYNESRYSWIN